MSTVQMEQRVENVERRVDRIEQILPTLATREDLKAAIAPLATKAELRAGHRGVGAAHVRPHGCDSRRSGQPHH